MLSRYFLRSKDSLDLLDLLKFDYPQFVGIFNLLAVLNLNFFFKPFDNFGVTIK